jgi:periplasmic divalent cation tolerance protein
MTEAQPGVVMVTVGSAAEAEQLAQILVVERLAACVAIAPITSTYRWQGEIQRDSEYQLTIKTDLRQFAALAARVRSLHSYDVPEVIGWPISHGAEDYLAWLRAQTEPELPPVIAETDHG